MIPVLYNKLENDFTHNGIGILTDTISCTITEVRNGKYELTLKYPVKGHLAEYLTEDTIIKAKANNEDEPQLFRIYKSSKEINKTTTYYAEHISYELNRIPVENLKISGVNAERALTELFNGALIECNYNATSDITTLNNVDIDEMHSIRNVLGGISGSILDVYGGEYHFDNYTVELLKERGKDNGVTIEYGKNLISAKQERNIEDVVTAIYPYAVYRTDDEEIKVTLPEKILVHEQSNLFANVKCEIVDLSDKFGDEEIVTETKLRNVAQEYVRNLNIEPKISITLSHADLSKCKDYKHLKKMESVKLCDIVTVIIDKLGINVKAKITEATYDCLKEKYTTLKIGDTRTNLIKTISEIQKINSDNSEKIKISDTKSESIRKALEKKITDVTAAITGNSGGYVVLYPETNPQEIYILDKPTIQEAKNIWRWNKTGLAHSSNGLSGPYELAITADGHIVANFIDVGELDGAILKAGSIYAETLSTECRRTIEQYSDDAAAEAINNLEIGGRNLAAGTTDEYKSIAVGRYYTVIYSVEIANLINQYNLSEGDNITFSVHIKTESGKQLCSMLQHYNTEANRIATYGTETSVENREGVSYVTTKIDTSYNLLRLCIRNVSSSITNTTTEYYKCIKLEKGNKMTDWTPSPEDVDLELTILSTNYTKLDQSLTGLTAEVAGNTSTIATKADNSTVTEIQNNLTTVTADLNGFKTTVSSTYTTKTEFDSLEIGGRNLIINSKLEIGYINSNGTITTSNNYRVTDYIKVNAGDNLIFQAWGDFVTRGWWDITHFDKNKAYIGGYGNAYWDSGTHYIQESNIVPYGTAYIRLSFTTPSESGIVKLEKGNKATDWTPAPEDVDSSIEAVDTHLTTVEQTADKINWIVKSGTSESNFTLTDRLAELTAEIISLNGNVKVSKDMIVDGAITAKKIATDAIKSRNYVSGTSGSYLNLANGSFDSPFLKFTQSMLQMGSVHMSTETDDYGKVKGGLYIEFVNSDTGTVGGHGDLYRLYLNPYNLDAGEEGTAIKLLKQNAYDQTVVKNIFSLWYSGMARLDGHFVCTGIIKADTFEAKNTVKGKKINSTATEYPNIYGNGTYLHLSHVNENTKGLVLQEDSVRPAGDNTQGLGNSSHRWGQIYSAYSIITTSDREEKKEIETLDIAKTKAFLKAIVGYEYKYISGTSDRKHYGMISQQVQEAMEKAGISDKDFAGFIKSPTNEGFKYGLRYEEFIAPLITGWQMHDDEIETLKQENKELKTMVQNLQKEIKILLEKKN